MYLYRVDGVSARASAAFTPGMVENATSATAGIEDVKGWPGTKRVPSPPPAAVEGLVSQDPDTQPSATGPDWITPDIYVVGPRGGSPWAYLRYWDHPDPVPILPGYRAQAVPGNAIFRTRKGGRRNVHQPYVNPRWPNLLTAISKGRGNQ